MKLHSDANINGREFPKGSNIPWFVIYPFFLVHMLVFGASGFFMAYSGADISVLFLFLHGGIAIFVYLMFYRAIFGRDEVKWMFINAALGVYGIYCEMRWLLGLVGKSPADYPWYVHVIPVTYFILYTFLLRQFVLDLTGVRDSPNKRLWVEWGYVLISIAFYSRAL